MKRTDFRPNNNSSSMTDKQRDIIRDNKTFRVKVYSADGKYWKTLKMNNKEYNSYKRSKVYKSLKFVKV